MIERCTSCRERVFFTGSSCPNCGADRDHPPVGPGGEPLPAPPPEPTAAASHPAALWAALALISLAIFSFMRDWKMVSASGSLDYRNRVTGTRLLAAGKDPYHYKWTKGQPERFLDPFDNPNMPMTKTTVSPAMLVAGWPWAVLPYPASKAAWLLAEWAMLAGLWLIWLRWPGQTHATRWWWSQLVVGFSYTLGWRHHVEHGQGYLPWAFLLSVWIRLSVGPPAARRGWLPGMLAGVLVCMRPPLLLGLGPFLVLRRRNQWLGAAAGLLLGLGAPALLKPSVWQDYGRAMTTWSTIYRSQTEPWPGVLVFPATIEGMPTENFLVLEVIQIVDSSWHRVCRLWGWREIPDPLMLAVLVLGFGIWLWAGRRAGDAAFLLGLAGWSFLTDMFLPAYRYPYVDVMILNTLALLPLMGGWRRGAYALALLATLAGIWIVSIHPPTKWWIFLPTVAWVALALLALYQSARSRADASIPLL